MQRPTRTLHRDVASAAPRVDRLHPRALLTPFTDHVDLTDADRDAYASQAMAQRIESFQDIDVTLDSPPRRDTEIRDEDPVVR